MDVKEKELAEFMHETEIKYGKKLNEIKKNKQLLRKIILDARKETDATIVELSKVLVVSESTVGNYEKNGKETRPKFHVPNSTAYAEDYGIFVKGCPKWQKSAKKGRPKWQKSAKKGRPFWHGIFVKGCPKWQKSAKKGRPLWQIIQKFRLVHQFPH